MDENRPSGRHGVGEHLGDFVAIERGALIRAQDDKEVFWPPGDEVALRVQASGGVVSVAGKLYVQELDPSGPALLTVLSSSECAPAVDLEMSLLLFDFQSGSYDVIGIERDVGGPNRLTRFETSFAQHDCHIDPEGEMRFRLYVSAGNTEEFALAIRAVTLSLKREPIG